MAVQYFEGIGRRKSSTARVRVMTGDGKFVVNSKPVEAYFTRLGDLEKMREPLKKAGVEATVDISVIVRGGGVTGQSDAVLHGLSRALIKMTPDLQPAFRKSGFLTRDARIKERKKPGLKRARKAPTYTKR